MGTPANAAALLSVLGTCVLAHGWKPDRRPGRSPFEWHDGTMNDDKSVGRFMMRGKKRLKVRMPSCFYDACGSDEKRGKT